MRYSASTRAGDRALLGSISSIDPAAGMSEARRKPASLSPPILAQQRQNPGGLEAEPPVSNNDLFLFSSALSRCLSLPSHWLGGLSPLWCLLRQCGRLKARARYAARNESPRHHPAFRERSLCNPLTYSASVSCRSGTPDYRALPCCPGSRCARAESRTPNPDPCAGLRQTRYPLAVRQPKTAG